MTGDERRAEINRRINETLGVFDGMLRREQEVLAQARGSGAGSGPGGLDPLDPTTGSGSEEGTGAGDRGDGTGEAGDGQGQGDGTERDGTGAGTGSTAGGAGTGRAGGTNQQGGGGGVGGGALGGSGPNTVPADIPDGSDDDIVARQLREAAMKETDPELREKLWQEYRDYRKGS